MTFSLLRLRIAMAAAVVAIVGILTAPALEPSGAESSTAKAFALARAHEGIYFASVWADVIGFCAAAFAAVTLVGLVRGRGAWLTAAGGWLTTVSMLAIGLNLLGFAQIVLAQQPDQAVMIHAYNQIGSSPALIPFFVIASLSVVGPVVLAFGLWRARQVGWWLPVLAVLGVAWFAALGSGDRNSTLGVLVQIPVCVEIGVWLWILRRAGKRFDASVGADPATVPAATVTV